MNNRQKIVQEQFLNNEEEVIKRLKQVYNKSLADIEEKTKALQDDINRLGALADLAEDDEEKAKILSMQQSKVYQKQYQDAMKKQIGSVLDQMQVEEFKTVSDYLNKCYEEGFVGTMYDLQGQGIPLCFPMDQEAIVRAVQIDSKISQGLYSRLGEDVSMLKKKITAEVARGISTGVSYQQIAQQLAGVSKIGFNNAVRIARTEGHRIATQSAMDACYKAKDHGADIVKQWDATLDSSTRESHSQVDMEIRELDKPFSNGLMFPGDPRGGAAEVVNCRCSLDQRARWELEGEFTKWDGFTGELKTFESQEAYDEYKKAYFSKENKQYMKYVEEMQGKYNSGNFEKVMTKMTDAEYKHFTKLQAARPTFEGMYRNQPYIKKINATKYDDFKAEYLKAADSLQDAGRENIDYSARRKERMAQRNKTEQLGESNVESLDVLRDRVATKHNININTDEIGSLTNEAKRQIEAIDNLLDEYNSTMVDFRFAKGSWTDGEGGACYMIKGKSSVAVKTTVIKKNVADKLNLGENNDLMATYHEFAHSFSQSREGMDDEFWKEIKKVRTQYRKGLKEIEKAEIVDHSISFTEATAARKKIFISDYANSDIDEFLAEAFAQAKLSANPSPYAKDVLKIVDKHFKKNTLTNGMKKNN